MLRETMTAPQRPRNNNKVVAGIFVGIAVLGGLFPLWYSKVKKIDTNKPFTGEAVVRGAYFNAGSRDVGPDPDYKPINPRWKSTD